MLAPLLHAWNLNLGYAKRLVADVSDDKMALQPAPEMNHAAWVLGHLACTADMLGAMVGVKPVCPPEWTALFDWNSSPSSDASEYPAKSVLLKALEDAHAGVAAAARTNASKTPFIPMRSVTPMSHISPASFLQTLQLREEASDLLQRLHAQQAAAGALSHVSPSRD